MISGKLLFKIAGLTALVALAFYFAGLAQNNESVRQAVTGYGYTGIFIVSLIGGFNLLVPIPVVAFMPLFLESGFNFWPAILTITLGMTLADSVSYVLGRLGHQIAHHWTKEKFLEKLESFKGRYEITPVIIIFLFASFAPLPNEVLLVPFGFIGYRFLRILPVLVAGNFIFNILYSLGALGIFNAIWGI